MSDPADPAATGECSPPDEAFVAWLAGERDHPPSDVEWPTLLPGLTQLFVDRVARDGAALPLMLERLACARNAGGLLEAVLTEHWAPICEALPSFPSRAPSARAGDRVRGNTDDNDPVSPLLVYLLLSVTPKVVSPRDVQDVAFLRRACAFDLSLLRHILAWASSQPAKNDRGWNYYPNGPAPATTWGFVAQWIRAVFSEPRAEQLGAWSDFSWRSVDGTRLAHQVVSGSWDDLSDALRRHGGRVFKTHIDLAIELAKLSQARARQFAASSAVLDEFAKETTPKTLDLRYGRQRSDGRIEAMLRLLPLEQLELPHRERVDEGHDPSRRELDRKVMAVGWAIGVLLYEQDRPRTAGSVAQLLQRYSSDVHEQGWVGVSLLWADLIQLAEYQHTDSWKHRDHIAGVLARLTEHLRSAPDAWALSTPEILHQAEALGREATDLLALGAAQHTVVADAIKQVSEEDPNRAVRDLAQGLHARALGGSMPGDDLRRWLADSAARAFDGIPLFPHPLTPLTKTWLGSADVEGALARSMRQAMVNFGALAKDHGAAQEEHLTGTLLRDLENAFRDTSLRLESGGHPRLATTISISHRPVLKSEEKRWGCDVALLLDVSIRPSVELRLAQLVQVKKSEAFAAKRSATRNERWRLDVPQLAALLEMSESSAYWLILSTGEVICVTASWLYGLARGRDALSQRSVTLGYNDVRNAAIPMEQFMPELCLGTWVGSTNETTLSFAAGENTNLTPRHIFEIVARVSEEQ